MRSGKGVIVPAVRSCLRGLADLLLPEVCEACGTAEVAAEGLCTACNVRLLSLVALPYCPRCGATIGPNIPIRQDGCSACPTTLGRFARVFRLGPYTEPLRSAIRELKYRRRDAVRRNLGRLLGQAVLAQGDDPPFDLVLPVPMHWQRRLGRGYNHARILARTIAREIGAPLGDELIRVRNTPPQTHLSRTRRIENVRGAFDLRSRRTVEGANILLVDDVTTTGATANEAARALLSKGASRIVLAVAAKSEPPTAYTQHWT